MPRTSVQPPLEFIPPQPNLGKQKARMVVGQPLSVNQYWEPYQASRQGAKQAVADLTRELQAALEDMLTWTAR